MFSTELKSAHWLEIPKDVRQRMAKLFNIPRTGTGQSQNFGNRSIIISDGYTDRDLSVLTVAKMQAFLDSADDSFWVLIEATVKKVQQIMEDEVVALTAEREALELEESTVSEEKFVDAFKEMTVKAAAIKRRGRKPKEVTE